jgi:hypothetical protein
VAAKTVEEKALHNAGGSNLINKVLLHLYTCSWDDRLVRDIFVEEDA